MEYGCIIGENKRVLIFDEGNNVNLLLFVSARNIRLLNIINDYHRNLIFTEYAGEVYLAYISVGRELIVYNLNTERKMVLYKDTADLLNISNLSFVKCEDGLYVLYKAKIGKEISIRYISVISGSDSISIMSGMIKDYNLYNVLSNYIMSVTYEKNQEKNYRLEISKDEFDLKEIYEKHDVEKMIKKQREEFKEKYDELASFSKEMQEEGKRWRDMYYRVAR